MTLSFALRETGSLASEIYFKPLERLFGPISPRQAIDESLHNRVMSSTPSEEGRAILQMIHDTYAEKNVTTAETAFTANWLGWSVGIFVSTVLPDILSQTANSPADISTKAIIGGVSAFIGLATSEIIAIIPGRLTEVVTRLVIDPIQRNNQHRDINAYLHSEGIGL